MRAAIRRATAWIAAVSLIDGLLLPFVATPAIADPDGACGPALVAAQRTDHLEAAVPVQADHCAVCHLRNAITSASTSSRAALVPPTVAGLDLGGARPDRTHFSEYSQASPRGPPAQS